MTALLTPPQAPDTVPMGHYLSMFDPVYLGIDEYLRDVRVVLTGHNVLSGGEPGAGKSTFLHTVVGHAALSLDARLVLLDGKLVELGMYRRVADAFVGADLPAGIRVLKRMQKVLDNRYQWLDAYGRQKITAADGLNVIVLVVDELAYFTATAGTKEQQETFSTLLRDIVSRGRAAAVLTVAATQRPSGVDILPASLRDLFGYRHASRCTTDDSSDLVLARGWASRGYSAASIRPDQRGVGWLLAEGGLPFLMKTPFLTAEQIDRLVDYAVWLRRTHGLLTPDHGTGTAA